MFVPGLVSITFRRLAPGEIISLVKQGGLAAIEWGGDVHVPHGDVRLAAEVGRMTRDAGLRVAAYGSYYRVGDNPDFGFDAALAAAEALGAPLLRVWAGRAGSATAASDYRRRVAEDAMKIAGEAALKGIRVAFEFHGGTLTDTTESAIRLLADAEHPNLFCYWQPPVGWRQAECETSLEAILPRLAALHVFHWADDRRRLPLALGEEGWRPLLKRVAAACPDRAIPALVEFVRDDSPEAFLEDARTLRQLTE